MTLTLHLQQLSITVQQHVLLDHLNVALDAGKLVGVIGANGAGKSTLLKSLAQLIPYQGSAFWNGDNLATMSGDNRARQLAYLPQQAHLQWAVSVRDIVALGRFPHSRHLQDNDWEIVEQCLNSLQLQPFAQRAVTQLSTGEQARVLLARALAVQAPLLLADEPIAALDPYYQLQIIQLLSDYAQQGKLVLLVLHNLSLAARFCQHLLLLHQGCLVAEGCPAEVLTEEHLTRCYRVNVLRGEHRAQQFVLPWEQVI